MIYSSPEGALSIILLLLYQIIFPDEGLIESYPIAA